MPRVRMKCECGVQVTSNTWASHLRGSKCRLPDGRKNQLLDILKTYTKNGSAWLIKDGLNATRNSKWWLSVVSGETEMSDWTFDSPRPKGQITPDTAKKMSTDRVGSNNPLIKCRAPNYNLNELKTYVKGLLDLILNGEGSFREIIPMIEETYPDYSLMFADIKVSEPHKRGHNKKNAILSHILDTDIESIIKISHKLRGRSISKGQLASEKFLSFASKHAASITSSLRTSTPQKILYEMILSVDKNAIIEKPWKFGKIYKAFDIYSPAIKSVIEMHGRTFHDLSRCGLKLESMVKKNIENDLLKKSLVENLGVGYLEFWDDETSSWSDKIRNLYGKDPISYEEASNKVYEITRKS